MQVLYSFLNTDLGTLGYQELATPASFRVDGKQVSQFTLLTNPGSGRPVYTVAYGAGVAVLKMSDQASQEREVRAMHTMREWALEFKLVDAQCYILHQLVQDMLRH
jgi:hypothetical protein